MLESIGLLIGANTAVKTLPELWNHMLSAPVTIIFTVFSVAVLYYLPRKVPFFKNVNLGGRNDHTFLESDMFSKDFFSSKKRDPILKKRENLIATSVYFLIFIVLVIIFISLVFNLSNEF